MNRIYGVIFSEGSKAYFFNSAEEIELNTNVIVETERGEQFGKIVSVPDKNKKTVTKNILRIATEEDYQNHLTNLKENDKALRKCREIKDELGLEMKVISASFTFDKKQLLFNFLADERVDFRELARKLASIYRTRIELRQVGPRDKAKEIGGIGICGQKLCCSNFLNQMETVSISMAKNQNMALNPTKINGSCNRLLCCLAYEDEEYLNCRKDLPEIGNKIKTPKGDGTVINLDILNKKYTVATSNDRIEMSVKPKNEKSDK